MSEPKFFATFPQKNEALRDRYVLLAGDTEAEARVDANNRFGDQWSMLYPIADLAGQVERFGLTEHQQPRVGAMSKGASKPRTIEGARGRFATWVGPMSWLVDLGEGGEYQLIGSDSTTDEQVRCIAAHIVGLAP